MDALSEVLRMTRLTGGVFLHAEFTHPWCVRSRISGEDCAPFLGATADIILYHYVLEGRLRVKAGDAPVLELQPGEAVLFPRNDWHLLGGDLSLPPVATEDVVRPPADGGLSTIKIGGGGARTRIICGFLGGEKLARNPIVSTLPAVMHLDLKAGGSAEWIRSTLGFAANEIAAGRMGSETIMAKISELLFVEAIRRYVEGMPVGQTGWLAGLRDPYVARALALLHVRLSDAWTVAQLGREVGLSRSALAERFTQIIGQPPMQYLAGWRMQVAAHELRNSSKSLSRIAQEVGYESEAAFSRAFKRVLEMTPAKWRRTMR